MARSTMTLIPEIDRIGNPKAPFFYSGTVDARISRDHWRHLIRQQPTSLRAVGIRRVSEPPARGRQRQLNRLDRRPARRANKPDPSGMAGHRVNSLVATTMGRDKARKTWARATGRRDDCGSRK
jgi:hypothetical protein